ncbi:DUF3376 domain-containing protein [Actinokineospora soli]|uniref:DUF3376 domain-containing protein n=1 Tax=Actinokineospora soli TaxID=1048753 RepID=A0ABW2TSK2_9PSEU
MAANGNPDATLATRLYDLVDALYPHYKDVKIRRAARDLTDRLLRVPGANPYLWSYERIRAAAERAQRLWAGAAASLPYAPATAPPAVRDDIGPDNLGWRWGFSMAEALTSAMMGLLERLVHVVPKVPEEPYKQVCAARELVHEARFGVKRARAAFDSQWSTPVSTTLSEGYWAGRLDTFNTAMVGAEATSGVAVRQEVDKVAEALVQTVPILRAQGSAKLRGAGLSAWADLFDDRLTPGECAAVGLTVPAVPGSQAVRAQTDAVRGQLWLSRLLALEIATTCLADEAATGFDQPVELVQISLQTENPFAVRSRTPDDKAGGASLARFGGFLKRSWRVNDWIWGRMDGATMLCRLLLSQSRMRRVAVLKDKLATGKALDRRVDDELRDLLLVLFGVADPDRVPADTRDAVAKAKVELRQIHDKEVPAELLDQTATGIAELAAWALHARAAVEELPHLRAAIIADRTDGADPRSHGVRFIDEHESLLADLGRPGIDPEDPRVAAEKGIPALKAFDRAGVGREPLGQEASSDQAHRHHGHRRRGHHRGQRQLRAPLHQAAHAGRPRAAGRGAAAVLGHRRADQRRALGPLPRRAGPGRGGLLLALAVLGVLNTGVGGVAATIGGGVVLAAFGYAALRTQHLLHGLVLLFPVAPLVLLGIHRSSGRGTNCPRCPPSSRSRSW